MTEGINSGMFMNAADQTANADIVGNPGDPRAKAANSADQTVDPNPGLRCAIQGTNYHRINQLIAFDDDPSFPVTLMESNFFVNEGRQPRVKNMGRDQEVTIVSDISKTGK